MSATITATGALEARPGILERAGTSHLVDFLHWFGERVGHLRQLAELGRWRWLVYEPGGDCVGDEAERKHALNIARLYLLTTRPGPTPSAVASRRIVGPSSRYPGAGPTVGTTWRSPSLLSAEERTARGIAEWNRLCGERAAAQRASGEERGS